MRLPVSISLIFVVRRTSSGAGIGPNLRGVGTFRGRGGLRLWWLLALLAVSLVPCASAQTNLTSYVPGTTYYGRSNYTEYIAGNLPLIISAPHGGSLTPSELPDRTNTSSYTITTDADLNTDNLARAIRTAAFNRYGRYPHVIICDVDRSKVDCNREIGEGAQSNTNTQTLWKEFHEFIQIARRSVSNSYDRGLYIDLHGHGHTIQRNEIGYDLSDSDLFKTTFSSTDEDQSTIRAMSQRSRQTFTELVRSNLSLGALLEKRGYPCIPSPSNPNPGTNSSGATNVYFNGGYNVGIYGTSTNNGGTIDAIQIECNYTNVRDTSSNRAAFASNLIASLDEFFKYHLQMTMDTQATPPPPVNSFIDQTIFQNSQTPALSITLASSNSIFWGGSGNTNIVESSTANSSNTNAVDLSGFIFGGSNTNRSLVVRPRPNTNGSNVMVIVYQQATNGGVGTDWFYLNVIPPIPLIGWDFPTNSTTNTVNSGTNALGVVGPKAFAMASGLSPNIYTNAPYAWGASSWTANGTGPGPNGTTNNDYFSFEIQADTGKKVTISGISRLILQVSASGPKKWSILYAETNANSAFDPNPLRSYGPFDVTNPSSGVADTDVTTALSGAISSNPITLTAGKTGYFRLVGYGGATNGGTGRIVATNDPGTWDFALTGTVEDMPKNSQTISFPSFGRQILGDDPLSPASSSSGLT
ncbi:MAG: hypothetical protein WCI38_08345, partial [Chthoniobacterales bacterium]